MAPCPAAPFLGRRQWHLEPHSAFSGVARRRGELLILCMLLAARMCAVVALLLLSFIRAAAIKQAEKGLLQQQFQVKEDFLMMQVVSPVQLDFISEGDYFPFLIEHEASRLHGSSPTDAVALDKHPQSAVPKPLAPDVAHSSGEHPAPLPGTSTVSVVPERAKRHRDWEVVPAEEGHASQSVVRCTLLAWTVAPWL